MSRYMGMRMALEWIVLNDDCEWLDDDEPIPSVTAMFAADIYGIPRDEITGRLRHARSLITGRE